MNRKKLADTLVRAAEWCGSVILWGNDPPEPVKEEF
jgi:hypothetical protein